MCLLLLFGLIVMVVGATPFIAAIMGLIYGANVVATSNAKKRDAAYRERDAQRPPIPHLFPETGPLAERFLTTGEIVITYGVGDKAAWRCSLYTLLHKPVIWLPSLLVGLTVSLLVAFFVPLEFPVGQRLGVITVKFAGAFSAWMALNIFALWAQVQENFKGAEKPGHCNAQMSRVGFQHRRGKKMVSFEWREVTKVLEHQGDIYIWADSGGENPSRGFFVPQEAFGNEEEMECFRDIALRLWKSGGRAWDEVEVVTPP